MRGADLFADSTNVQTSLTLQFDGRVADKEHVWYASSCLNAGHHIITHILSNLSQSTHVKAFDEQLAQGIIPSSTSAPVFRLSFTPASRDGKFIKLRLLQPEEVHEVIKGKTNQRKRVGFLPAEWMQSVQDRKAR